jgi:uncharacterized surface protein with fasciclin (FAS1) repeats
MLFTNGFVLAALAGVACASLETRAQSLSSLLKSKPELSNLTEVLNEFPEFLSTVSKLHNITFLAPNNTAFAKLENSTQGETLENAEKDYLLNLLYYHVLHGTYDNLTDYYIVPTLLTSKTYTNVSGGQVVGAYYDDEEDLVGFYSGLDTSPEGARNPIPFAGGVMYIVDGILELPPRMSETVVGEDFNGTSWVEALNKTGLSKEVDVIPNSTYFIPVNDGFAAVQDSLSSLSNDELSEVLKYHIIPGTIGYYDTLKNGTTLTTLNGQNLTVFITDAGDMFINGAGIVYVDLIVANGVVHLLDNVLNPNATIVLPVNGTEDGVPGFQTSKNASATAPSASQSTGVAASASVMAGAATSLQNGAFAAVLLSCTALVLNL